MKKQDQAARNKKDKTLAIIRAQPKECPQCGAVAYKYAILPDQIGRGLHEAMYCSECGYEDDI